MEGLLARVASKVREIETSLGLDWRDSYSFAGIEDNGIGMIELSSAEVFDGLSKSWVGALERCEGEMEIKGEGNISVHVCLLAASSGRSLWVVSSVADIRREPTHAAELINQAIMGEDAEELKAQGDWHLVRFVISTGSR
jgi:hypothetical protein